MEPDDFATAPADAPPGEDLGFSDGVPTRARNLWFTIDGQLELDPRSGWDVGGPCVVISGGRLRELVSWIWQQGVYPHSRGYHCRISI